MSNNNVGTVYEQIIKDVLESSRVDFEESGTDEGIMNELKTVWQQKLSALQVASFPWDPKPDPPPAQQPAAPANPPAASYTQATLSPPTGIQAPLPLPMPAPQGPPSNGVHTKNEGSHGGEPAIKQEPGGQPSPLVPHFPGTAPGAAGSGPTSLAQQRAAQALHNQYGPRAAASINALKTGPANPNQRPVPTGQAPHNAEQYRQQAAQRVQQQQQQQSNGSLGASQVDGPAAEGGGEDGYEGVICERQQDGALRELGRVDIDRMLHRQMVAAARRMEGGGLMLPLKAATKQSNRAGKNPTTFLTTAGPQSSGRLAQVDGPGDDDVKEEDLDDAINSDLDDPEDDLEESDEEGEELGQQMLCLYDKVQRVKNKWKCTLKDGILTVNGKEYVFHKATGEYEW